MKYKQRTVREVITFKSDLDAISEALFHRLTGHIHQFMRTWHDQHKTGLTMLQINELVQSYGEPDEQGIFIYKDRVILFRGPFTLYPKTVDGVNYAVAEFDMWEPEPLSV